MKNDISKIPADEVTTMTDYWHRAFAAHGCNPCCHSCGDWIKPGHTFQLATVKAIYAHQKRGNGGVEGFATRSKNGELQTREVMICGKCDAKDFEKRQYEENELYKKRRAEEGGGCYRVNGVIVH